MKRKWLLLLTVGVLLTAFLPANSFALKFTDPVALGQHVDTGVYTDEFFLVFDTALDINIDTLKMKRATFSAYGGGTDFSDLIGKTALTAADPVFVVTWQAKALTKANKKYNKLFNKGKTNIDNFNEWLADQLDGKQFKVRFKAVGGGPRYTAKASFTTFNNPADGGQPGGGDATSVPEPATLLLLGAGILGVASMRRFKK